MRKVKYKAISPEGQVHHIDNLLKWVDEMNANGKLFSKRYLQQSLYTRGTTGFGSWHFGFMNYKGWKFKPVGDRTKGKGEA